MAKDLVENDDKVLKEKSAKFLRKINSEMSYESDLSSDIMSFEWLSEIELACPYIDNIVRNPRLALVKNERIVKVEKVRKITVATVKDLTKHTTFINKIDKKTQDVEPSKLLEVRSVETYNTYENRYIYTLIENLVRFLSKKEKQLEEFETKNTKTLEYTAESSTGDEKINIEFKITAKETPKDDEGNALEKDIVAAKVKIKIIKQYISGWYKTEFMKALIKQHVPLVLPPIRKTNLILKNPNFQFATRLWNYLQAYENDDADPINEKNNGSNIIQSLLDNTFLVDYYILNSIKKSKREQKKQLTANAKMMLNYQIQKAISILLDNGIKIKNEEIMAMVAEAIKNEKAERQLGSVDVKKKFKSAMEDYLERTKDYL